MSEKEYLRSTYKLGPFSKSEPLILTNKRLIIGNRSIDLDEILEAYAKVSGTFTTMTRLAIRLKNGEEIVCTPKLERTSLTLLSTHGFELEAKASVDRWVSLINRLLK